MTALLEIDGLTKSYPSRSGFVKAIESVTFSVPQGSFVSVVGPSGCGKTTLMMSIAGLRPISGGEVRMNGRPIDGPPPGMSMVFQDYSRSLFPWLSVGKNVAMALEGQRKSRKEIVAIVEQSLHSVGLDGSEKLYPWQLSGGMQQRVAIARGLATSPQLLLMDEPFASVDAQTRANLEDLVRRLWDEYSMTILFVTHDIDEAVYLADQVVVLSQGPSVVRDVINVDLPRQRDQIATKELPAFAHLRANVFSQVMGSARRTDLVTSAVHPE